MLSKLISALKAIHKDEGGAMAVEKVLLILLISLPIGIGLFYFRDRLIELFNGEAGKIDSSLEMKVD